MYVEYKRLKDIKLSEFIGQRVFIQFLLQNKDIREQKDGVTKFATFNMVDKDIQIDAKIFAITDQMMQMLENGSTYNAAIDIKPYAKSKTGYSCIIYNLEKSDIPSQEFIDWQPSLEISGKIIQDTVVEISESCFGKIAYPILVKYWNKFCTWTAARGQHHNQLGGLITHTAEVVQCCKILSTYFCQIYGDDFINKDLLLAAAMLHDVGKCNELCVDINSGQAQYTTYATLQTHIMDVIQDIAIEQYRQNLGVQIQEFDSESKELVDTKEAVQLEDEIEAVKLLTHLVAQHHGKLECGQPITPNTPEAYILHLADLMSADMFKFNKVFKGIEPGSAQTSWNNGQTQQIYKDTTKLNSSDLESGE